MSNWRRTLEANPEYAYGQLERAFKTANDHGDQATRVRATERARRWARVIQGMTQQSLRIGSRTPLRGTPAWVTPEVVTGGFATGEMLASGPLRPHERSLLDARGIKTNDVGSARARLNAWMLSDDGLAWLRARLESGAYRIGVVEENALLVVATLLRHDLRDEARVVLDEITPWFNLLRFYPVPADGEPPGEDEVCRTSAEAIARTFRDKRLNERVESQREALSIWRPFYDRVLSHLSALVVRPSGPRRNEKSLLQKDECDGLAVEPPVSARPPPEGWLVEARQILEEAVRLRAEHNRCRGPDDRRSGLHRALRLLEQAVNRDAVLSNGMVRVLAELLASANRGRGLNTEAHHALRRIQALVALTPSLADFALVLARRLDVASPGRGLANPSAFTGPVKAGEADVIPEGTPFPPALTRKLAACREASVPSLIGEGLLPSGEALALVLPQLTGSIAAHVYEDPKLRQLGAELYSAFRRRRSLLLLNLQHQVTGAEVPWIGALELLAGDEAQAKARADTVLANIATLVLRHYPERIVPNRLLTELGALAERAGRKLVLVEEIAADIFMGQLTSKFKEAAIASCECLTDTLYARYYDLPSPQVLARTDLIQLCEERALEAGPRQGWSVAGNGALLEQVQILTSHNLAALAFDLDLNRNRGEDDARVEQIFNHILARHRMKVADLHANLIRVKQTAYAWRQLIFFLSLLPAEAQRTWASWMQQQLLPMGAHGERLKLVVDGLSSTIDGERFDRTGRMPTGARRFLGWTTAPHWMMP